MSSLSQEKVVQPLHIIRTRSLSFSAFIPICKRHPRDFIPCDLIPAVSNGRFPACYEDVHECYKFISVILILSRYLRLSTVCLQESVRVKCVPFWYCVWDANHNIT